jgi:hypothetical protein
MDFDDDDYRELLALWGQQPGAPTQESMRNRHTKVRVNPSRDDLKVRRRNNRRTATDTFNAGGDVQTRAELRASLTKASSLAEQARLLDEIAKLDSTKLVTTAQSRELDFANTVVNETMAPVRVHEHHTAATDWMGYDEPQHTDWQNRVVAEAAMWHSRVPEMVKADATEYTIQAEGKAQQFAGQFGIQAHAAKLTFVQYATFLRTQAASGLDQIQQTVDPHDNPKTTPLNPEVFDNFAPDVDPVNAGVSGTEDSNRNPLLQEIMSGGSGADSGAPEKPSEHDEQDNLSWNPPEGMQGDSTPPRTASLMPHRSMAIGGSAFTMDDFRRQAAAQAGGQGKAEGGASPVVVKTAAKCKDCKCELSSQNKGSTGKGLCSNCEGRKGGTTAAKEAASGLDQIQQTVDPHDNPKPTGLPPEVAFPLDDEFQQEWNTNGSGDAQPTGKSAGRKEDAAAAAKAKSDAAAKNMNDKVDRLIGPDRSRPAQTVCQSCQRNAVEDPTSKICNSCQSRTRPYYASVPKQADMFGASDDPHAVPQPNVANTPATTPPNATGSSAEGRAAGAADARAGERPSFADGSGANPYAQGYSEGYSSVDQSAGLPQNEPGSMAGPGNGVTHAASKTSSMIVTAAEREDPDFKKGYGYASRWKPGTVLVSTGSASFEAGLYAGISDNPEHQRAFVTAHRGLAAEHPKLGTRVNRHKQLTQRIAIKNEVPTNGLYLSASTSVDMNTMAPNTTPAADGSTPINGPGRPGPLDGQQDAATAGGPAPYNGAEPFGTPVVPTAGQTPPSPADALIGGGGMSTTQQVQAFRRIVQANLLAERKQGSEI